MQISKKLKSKCDTLLKVYRKRKKISYQNLVDSIKSNKELYSYSNAIPNAIEYIQSMGYTVVMPKEKKPKDLTKLFNTRLLDEMEDEFAEEFINAEDFNEEEFNKEVEDEIHDTITFVPDNLTWYLNSISQYPLLSDEETSELFAKIRQGDKKAKEKMINSNLRLVIYVAKKYQYVMPNFDILDIIQAGNIGLMTAIDKYSDEFNARFSTYAFYWIRQSITHMFSQNGRIIRLPFHIIEQLRYVHIAQNKLRDNLSRNPSLKEIADYMVKHNLYAKSDRKIKITEQKIADWLKYEEQMNATSLSRPIKNSEIKNPEDETLLIDIIPDDRISPIDDELIHEQMVSTVKRFIDTELTPREADIIRKRYGFEGREYTLEEVANLYGCTRERIRQIQKKVLDRVRSSKRLTKMLSGYL